MTAKKVPTIQVPKHIEHFIVSKEDLLPKLEERLTEVQKTAVVDGFRKGQAPLSILKAKFQNNLLMELAQLEIEDYINKYISEHNPKLIVNPGVIGFDKTKDGYEADVLFFTTPDVDINLNVPFKTLESTPITDDNINGYIEMNKNRFGTIDNSDDICSVKTDMLYVDIKEIDPITKLIKPNGFKIDTIIDISKVVNVLPFLGKKKDDTILTVFSDITNNIAEMYKILKLNPETETVSVNTNIHLKVLSVNRPVPAVIDETFFKKCFPLFDIASEEDFRKIIKLALEENKKTTSQKAAVHEHIAMLSYQASEVDIHEIMDHITRTNNIPLQDLSEIIDQIRVTIVMYNINKIIGDITEDDAKMYIYNQIKYLIEDDTKTIEIVDKLITNKNNINKAADNLLNERLFNLFSEQSVIEHA